MPTVIAIEAKPVEFEGISSDFYHLYLVKTVTDAQGRTLSEKVIRGSLGGDGRLGTLANVDLATSPDSRGSETPEERHRKVLNLGGRDAEDVWKLMVKHAQNIHSANLAYSFDIFREAPGDDLNSNSVIASVLHTVSIDWSQNYPVGITRSDAPLYGQLPFMKVNDILYGTANNDLVLGGVGSDRIYGGPKNDQLLGESGNDQCFGGYGNDNLIGGTGDDILYGGYGNDILRGEAGKDAFVFNSRQDNTGNVDAIWNFSAVDDTIWLDNNIFLALGPSGRLGPDAFWMGSAAHDATDRLVYNPTSGVLYYDPDGAGAEEQVVVTKLTVGVKMSYANFLVF